MEIICKCCEQPWDGFCYECSKSLKSPSEPDYSHLIKRLNIKAGLIEMGEKIPFGTDSALMRKAAKALESTQRMTDELIELREFRDKVFEAHPNIDLDIEHLL